MSEENEPNQNQKGRKSKKKSGRQKQQPVTTIEMVQQDFAACPRCSYFWAGYKVIVGDEGIDTAVAARENGWLTLQWSHSMRDLVYKSYGVRTDTEFFFYEGCCKECSRPFAFSGSDEEHPDIFRIELAPLVNNF